MGGTGSLKSVKETVTHRSRGNLGRASTAVRLYFIGELYLSPHTEDCAKASFGRPAKSTTASPLLVCLAPAALAPTSPAASSPALTYSLHPRNDPTPNRPYSDTHSVRLLPQIRCCETSSSWQRLTRFRLCVNRWPPARSFQSKQYARLHRQSRIEPTP